MTMMLRFPSHVTTIGSALALLDDFNRADGSVGSNWSQMFVGFTKHDIQSNVAIKNGSASVSYWNPTTFGPDVEVSVDIATSGTDFWIYCRVANPATGSIQGYEAGCENSNFVIYRITNGSFNLLASTAGTANVGDKIMMRAVGSLIELYKDTGSGWVFVLSATDATYNTAGYVGMEIDSFVAFDNFKAGNT